MKSPDKKPGLNVRGCNMRYASAKDGCVFTVDRLALV
jgi:hypothetical protein